MITPESGRVAVVLPLDRFKAWEAIAESKGFQLRRRCWIRGNPEAEVSRAMLEWTNGAEITLDETEVVIENQRGVLNSTYLHWAHPFLLEKT